MYLLSGSRNKQIKKHPKTVRQFYSWVINGATEDVKHMRPDREQPRVTRAVAHRQVHFILTLLSDGRKRFLQGKREEADGSLQTE